ncbi:hypothetical protein [Sanguibacter sp. HDW7]|uniref:hypothetical protein n=1 Tax=Sanguibacter sp. HDW7 TaxID=2714931 RepID=UPI00140CFB76|nr:hypothetical protein [Sanguibacter sp. HDW7]QIK82978.1 hypothetical protein G7063_04565 [Sanguibacter sp. HDW7]
MTTTDLDERTVLSDRTVALLRTAVPGLWAALVTTLLRIISPHLPGDVGTALAALLRSELALTLVVALVLALWYWLWRRIEHLVPDWLVRLALGSARTPGYALPAAVVETGGGRLVTGVLPVSEISATTIPAGVLTVGKITSLTPSEAALVADYRALEARPEPADIDDPDDDVDETLAD